MRQIIVKISQNLIITMEAEKKCLKCGECCKWLMFDISNIKERRMYLEYWKAHGCKIEGNSILVPMRCPHLTDDNLCDIHDKKPLLCKIFRGQKSDKFWIPKGCGFA